jgi:hypothetical protein
MRQCTAQEQLFCIYGNRQIIGQVYLLQVKSSLMSLRTTLIYQLTGNTSVFGNIDLLLGCWLCKYILVLTNTNSTIFLKGGSLCQLLISCQWWCFISVFFYKVRLTAVCIGLYHQLGSGGGS